MKKDDLLKFCRYYNGETEAPINFNDIQKTCWAIEARWLEMCKEDNPFINEALSDYIDFGLKDFSVKDNIPVTLKAVLLNRFFQYTERTDVEAFKKFYTDYYG